MASLKTIRLDGDNGQTRREIDEYLKELGVDLEEDINENE